MKLVLIFDLTGEFEECSNIQELCLEYSSKEEFINDLNQVLEAELTKYNNDYILYCEWVKKCPNFKNGYLQKISREQLNKDYDTWKGVMPLDVTDIQKRQFDFAGVSISVSKIVSWPSYYGVDYHIFVPKLPKILTLDEWFENNSHKVF